MSMMRISEELSEDLKVLKSLYRELGTNMSNGDIVQKLVDEELKHSHVKTELGYLKKGNVVAFRGGKPLVITYVNEFKVGFDDGSFLVNGSKTCNELLLICVSADLYEGGFVNE